MAPALALRVPLLAVRAQAQGLEGQGRHLKKYPALHSILLEMCQYCMFEVMRICLKAAKITHFDRIGNQTASPLLKS